eukprot:m.170352 g.170352  ORF g.170352 m.170352 type:complete len:63 (+) comp15337_c0_seq6:174-362(+)
MAIMTTKTTILLPCTQALGEITKVIFAVGIVVFLLLSSLANGQNCKNKATCRCCCFIHMVQI